MDSVDQSSLDENQRRKEIRLLSVKDDEFLFDKAVYTEEHFIKHNMHESIG